MQSKQKYGKIDTSGKNYKSIWFILILILTTGLLMLTGCPNPMNATEDDGTTEEETAEDITAPSLTLSGSAEPYLLLGSSWSDPGATATDDIDGDISASITSGGDTLNTNTIGTYTITYNVSDAAGNAAEEISRTVHVVHPFDARNYEFAVQWGSNYMADGAFQSPYCITIDSGNNVWVSDAWNQRIQSFSSTGVFQTKIYMQGILGGFMDADDNLYITNEGDNKIYKCDTSGNILLSWGGSGTGNGQFIAPHFIAFDAVSVYVTDTYNHRVQKFDMDGNFIATWGGNGTGNGQFDEPRGIAVSGGFVYVADVVNHRIQKFDTDGTFIAAWGSNGTGNCEFNQPQGICIDGNNLYVADSRNHRIQIINATDGSYVDQFGSEGTGEGEFDDPTGISIDSSGNIYVTDTVNTRVQKFNSSYTFQTQWGHTDSSSNGKFREPRGCCIDGDDKLYVADTVNSRIQIFDNNGTFINKWDTSGSGNGELQYPTDVAYCSSTGYIYVADHGNHRVQKFTTAGIFQSVVGGPGTGNGQFETSLDNGINIAVDSTGNLFVLETEYNRVHKFDDSGTWVATWGNGGTHGTNPGDLGEPWGIAVAADDTVWVTDEERGKLIQFSNAGAYITETDIGYPRALRIDSNDNRWIRVPTGPGELRLFKFDANLNSMVVIGADGTGDGEFMHDIEDIAVDSSGNIFALDLGNARVQKFMPADYF